jgi:hypothetical protein
MVTGPISTASGLNDAAYFFISLLPAAGEPSLDISFFGLPLVSLAIPEVRRARDRGDVDWRA